MHKITITVYVGALKAIFDFNLFFVSFSTKQSIIINILHIWIMNEDSPPFPIPVKV